MSNQIASMFASLGFKVDTTGLDSFNSKLREVRGNTVVAARNIGVLAEKLRSASSALDGVTTKLDKVSLKKANQNIADSYKSVASNVNLVEKALTSIQNNQKGITKALGRIHASVRAGEPLWEKYRATVRATKEDLVAVNGKMKELRANSTVSLRVNQGRGGSSSDSSSNTRQTNNNMFGGMFGGRGDFSGGFFRSMLPAVALAGGLPSAGFAVKETVQAGRERIKMSNIMTASTKDAEEYAKAMAYVRSESNRLGQSTTEMGLGFAKVMQSVQGKLSLEKTQKIFTGFGELMTVMGNSADDQKGVYRAMTQMFSKGKIEAEEEGQMAERGLPMKELIKKAAMEVYKVDQKGYEKMRKAGAVKAEDVLPRVAELMSEMANKNSALDKALNQSVVKQQQFMNRLNDFAESIMTGGLDSMLGDIFDKLSALVDILSEITTGAKGFKKTLDDLTDGNGLLSITLTIVLGLLFKKRKAIASVARNLKSFSSIARMVTGFLNGRMGQALITITKRFGWVGLAIAGALTLLQQFGKAMEERKAGKWTWLDDFIMKVENTKLRFKLMTLEMQLTWQNWKNRFNGDIEFTNKWETFRYFGIDGGSKLTNRELISRNAGKHAAQQQTQQALKNAEASRGGNKSPIPYAAPNAFGKEIPKININSMTNVHIDKDGNIKRQEATADVMP